MIRLGDVSWKRLFLAAKGKTGWGFVEAMMDHQIESGLCTPEQWNRHLDSTGLKGRYLAYLKWKRENPGAEDVPAEVNAISEAVAPPARPQEDFDFLNHGEGGAA